jgi:hypothetical protein
MVPPSEVIKDGMGRAVVRQIVLLAGPSFNGIPRVL